jgi:3-hydroxyisobutyrate dehydrogenase-like beta-hydroxyacid dehydrogenase
MLHTPVQSKVFVDCSTIHPDTTQEIEAPFSAAGASFVAMPVFGAPAAADAGKLLCVPAGKPEDIDRIRPFITDVIARGMVDLSGRPTHHASLLKLTGNTMILSMVESLAEAHVLAEKSGLGVDTFHSWVEAFWSALRRPFAYLRVNSGIGAAGPHAAYSNRMLSGDYYKREEVRAS